MSRGDAYFSRLTTTLASFIHEGSESGCDSSDESVLDDGVLSLRRFHGL